METQLSSLSRSFVLQYARFHNLAEDHTLEDDPQVESILQLLSPPQNTYECYHHPLAPSSTTSQVTHLFKWEDIASNCHIQDNSTEKLGIDLATASLLRSSIQTSVGPSPKRNQDDFDEASLVSSDYFRLPRKKCLRLKLDTPLLKTDHVLNFHTSVRNASSAGMGSFRQEETGGEADEGLAWPAKCLMLSPQYDGVAQSEKLKVQRDGAILLKEVVTGEDLSKAHIDSIVSEEGNSPEWRVCHSTSPSGDLNG